MSGAHEGNFRLRVPVQFFQRTGHSTGVDDHLVLLIALLQLFQVAFQRLTLAHTFHAADSLELRAVNGDPLALHQAYRARQPAPTRLPQRLRLRDACAGTRLSSCGLELAVPATTSTRCFVGTQTPAAARNGSAANSRTDRVSEQVARIIAWPPSLSRLGTPGPQTRHVQPINKCIDDTAHVIVRNQLLLKVTGKRVAWVRPLPCT